MNNCLKIPGMLDGEGSEWGGGNGVCESFGFGEGDGTGAGPGGRGRNEGHGFAPGLGSGNGLMVDDASFLS
jgi:hypothetical protein